MFVRANRKVKPAIFPLLRLLEEPGQAQLAVAGAAFFIDAQGTFATCAHLFDNAAPGMRFIYWGHLPENVQNPPIDIVELGRNNVADIVIGRLNMPNPTSFLELGQGTPDPGKHVCIVGYPLARITLNAHGGPDFGQVRRYPQPSFVLDGMESELNGRHHRGFCVRDAGHSGMSGGPVVDENGVVLGMQAAVGHREDRLGPHRLVVHNALVIGVDHIRTLWDEIKEDAVVELAAQAPDEAGDEAEVPHPIA